ncbi:hypothetical protein CDEST_01265 [Colletotrichum destructivum]|uniref:Uncharacterized protein n=1 Tax=Colletotrichum destructivum TaxID=34406 RepID=A0AAX4HYJ4_9PEZI|nr:hypothetical protein CDEST_01265 [Colletotrichum destructivum]
MAGLRTPTIEMPLMDDVQARLLDVLDRGGSLYELSLLLPEVSKALAVAGMPAIPHATVAQLSNDHLRQHESLEVLQVAPRKLLVSMIRGTVAYDCAQDPSEEYGSQTDEPGVYVIAVGIHGRGGKFLNWDELGFVATVIDEYADAFEIRERRGVLTLDEEEKLQQADRIDAAYGLAPGKAGMRFIESASIVGKARELANGIRRRIIQPYPGPAAGEVHQTQSPQYIGCSTKLSGRLKDYDVATGLKLVNRPLALLVHVLKSLGHEPFLTRRVVVKVYRASQLQVAERLFIALARSYLWQDGLNVAEGGSRAGINGPRLADSKDSVWVRSSIMRTNLDLSMEDVAERQEYLHNIVAIDDLQVRINSKIRQINQNLASLDEAVEFQERNIRPAMEAKAEALRQQLDKAVAQRVLWKELDELASLMSKCMSSPRSEVPPISTVV